MPDSWSAKSVAAQRGDTGSILAFYRAALGLRRESEALRTGSFVWLESPPGSLLFARDTVVCAVNVDADAFEPPEGEVLLASGPLADGRLPRDASAWIRTRSA
jgi:alpha-glucosidase